MNMGCTKIRPRGALIMAILASALAIYLVADCAIGHREWWRAVSAVCIAGLWINLWLQNRKKS